MKIKEGIFREILDGGIYIIVEKPDDKPMSYHGFLIGTTVIVLHKSGFCEGCSFYKCADYARNIYDVYEHELQ